MQYEACNLYLGIRSLPPGFDVLLGMDWLQKNNVWLHPGRKTLVFPDKSNCEGVSVCLTSATQQVILPDFSMSVKLGKRFRSHGVYSLTHLENDYVQFVSHSCFIKMMARIKTGKMSYSALHGELPVQIAA